jgi:hypothetical protein
MLMAAIAFADRKKALKIYKAVLRTESSISHLTERASVRGHVLLTMEEILDTLWCQIYAHNKKDLVTCNKRHNLLFPLIAS